MKNSVTKETSAFFEPALDYIVCKIPRWDLGKFQGVDRELGSSMKSVGEVMALRIIGQGMHGFVENKDLVIPDIDKALHEPTDKRIFVISKAMRAGYSVDQIHELTKIDRWFLQKLMNIVRTAQELETLDESVTQIKSDKKAGAELIRRAKIQGFSDFQIARAIWKDKMEDCHMQWVREYRKSLGIVPVVKQIDTLAAEYPAQTNYLYLTYSGIANDVKYLGDKKSIVVLGSGAYRIGSSVEFDWCGVHVKFWGTTAKSIDNAEDRHKFSSMLDSLGIDQPRWRELTSLSDIYDFVKEVGYPVLVRPSYVLSGAAMNVCSNNTELEQFLQLAANVSKKHPVVVSEFIQNAKEIEMDAVARNGEVLIYAISEHIEFAGVHSGDATIQFPPQKLYVETMRRIKKVAGQIALALNISGPFNIQFLAKNNDIKVIECNLRASRSFPFVSKVLKINFIELATKVMMGLPVEKPNKNEFDLDYVGIKASQRLYRARYE